MSAWERKGLHCLRAVSAVLLLSGGSAWAANFDLGYGVSAETRLTLNYALSMRAEDQAEALINGPIDPFQSVLLPDGQLVGFTHTGLPTTTNFDDGDRNFDKGDLTHNRITAYGEITLSGESSGIVVSGDVFYDDVYYPKGKKNANTSPETVNKEDTPEAGAYNEFHEETRKYNGHRARLLNAYYYQDFMLGDEATLNFRIGQQVVAWGESLFLYGIALSQGRADATRAYVPGAETKEILLPTNQVAIRFSPGILDATLLGFYKLDFKATEVFPTGDYLSIADVVGPGGEITYGSVNPGYAESCPGLLKVPGVPIDLSALCTLGMGAGALLGAEPNIMVERGYDIIPDKDGQWGVGLTFPIGDTSSLGLYHLRYHNANPYVNLVPGFATVTKTPLVTTQVINQYVPVEYQVGYADGIHLSGLSFSTTLFGVNVAGELIYRENADVQVAAVISGVLSPVYSRGSFYQALVSGLYVTNPNIWFEELVILGEAGYVKVDEITPFEEQMGGHVEGIYPTGDGDEPFNDRESYGFQALTILTKRNMFDGWDFKVTGSWGQILKGNPPLTAAFGALYGEDDRRASLGFGLQYLQNFEVSASYNMFLGTPETTIGDSPLLAHPYTDRDYVALNLKYNF